VKRTYVTKGTCSNLIELEIEDGIINNVQFTGGCDGSQKGIAKLVAGMSTADVISRLEGIKCGNKDTSCPDQLAKALKTIAASE